MLEGLLPRGSSTDTVPACYPQGSAQRARDASLSWVGGERIAGCGTSDADDVPGSTPCCCLVFAALVLDGSSLFAALRQASPLHSHIGEHSLESAWACAAADLWP